MPGIMDIDPRRQGLLAAAFQGLQASGPKIGPPASLGQIIGQAGQAGMQQMNRSAIAQQEMMIRQQELDLTKQLRQQQIEQAQSRAAELKRNQEIDQRIGQKMKALGGQPFEVMMSGILPDLYEKNPEMAFKTMADINNKIDARKEQIRQFDEKMQDRTLSREQLEAYRNASLALQTANSEALSAYRDAVLAMNRDKAKKEDEPLKATELLHYVDKEGNFPPPGTTMGDIQAKGYSIVSTGQISAVQAAKGANAALDQLQAHVDKLWPNPKAEGFSSRLNSAMSVGVGGMTQSNADAALYLSFKDGTMAPLIRALGEKGALAEGDVRRAINLLPKAGDSDKVAHGKLAQIKDMLKKATSLPGVNSGLNSGPKTFPSMSDAEAAAARGDVKPGDKIIVNGISGSWQ